VRPRIDHGRTLRRCWAHPLWLLFESLVWRSAVDDARFESFYYPERFLVARKINWIKLS
jgi:hypothetical protein